MNEKLPWRIVIGLAVVVIGLSVWLGLVYRNGGDTALALEQTQSELDVAIAGNASLAKELIGANETIGRIIKEQRESDTYQQQLEDELEQANYILGQLEVATGELAEGIERVEDIAWEYEELIRLGNEYIENGEE